MPNRLQNKVCIITGAARGIGAQSARLFASEGAKVIVSDLREEQGEQVAADIRAAGGHAEFVRCDVTRETDAKILCHQTINAFGTINVLFNNAGTVVAGKLEELTEADWDKNFNVNVKSMFFCSKYAIPIMRRDGGGSIINMGSESGLIGFPMHPAYCASKAAVLNLTRSMATGHAADKIRVNCLCPGTIPTPLYHEFIDSLPNKDEVVAELKRTHPLGLGTEMDIANAALFLASDESRYMTGAPLVVDGGFTAI
jgi:NAD(P)-dependent dehydrogenase (short-subunit alcohol dehydrogenase family)